MNEYRKNSWMSFSYHKSVYTNFPNDFWSFFLFIHYLIFPLSKVFLNTKTGVYVSERGGGEREKLSSIEQYFRTWFHEIILSSFLELLVCTFLLNPVFLSLMNFRMIWSGSSEITFITFASITHHHC